MSLFQLTMADVVQMMDGHAPPTDPEDRDAYWIVFERRLLKTFSYDEVKQFYLLAGAAPDEYLDWQRNWQQERRRAERRPV